MNDILKFFIALLILLTVKITAAARDETGPAALPEPVAAADSLSRVSAWPPFGFDAFHVQGLEVTSDFIFFTSVDKMKAAGWIFKLDRRTMKLLRKRNLARLLDIHPSGIDYDGENVWLAMAVYSESSSATVMALDPETLKIVKKFDVKDHIGAVARDGNLVIGANWDAKQFYFWNTDGIFIEKRESPTGAGYQDCKGASGFLMCGGGGYLDWIDIKNWKLVKRFEIKEESDAGNSIVREGSCLLDGRVLFLPDDGPGARVYEYKFVNSGG
jgi:hypothetical protein